MLEGAHADTSNYSIQNKSQRDLDQKFKNRMNKEVAMPKQMTLAINDVQLG